MPFDIANFHENLRSPSPKEDSFSRPIGHRALDQVGEAIKAIDGTVSIVDSRTGFELTVVDELWSGIKSQGGLSKLVQFFESLRDDILSEPHGDNSVDRQKQSTNARARIVHRIPESSPIGQLIPGKELVIKTTGDLAESINQRLEDSGVKARSNATEQFRSMLAFQRLQEAEAPDGFFGIIKVAKVYGTIREPINTDGQIHREWLLMEYIPANRTVSNKPIVHNGHIKDGFSPLEYPSLGAIVVDSPEPFHGDIPTEELISTIIKNYPSTAPYMGDFGNENLLETLSPRDETGKIHKQYVIIDVEKSI